MTIKLPFYRGLCCLGWWMFLLAGRCTTAASAENIAQRSASQILRHQTRDGALAMSEVSASPNEVVPYFANLSAIGLMNVYRQTHQVALRDAVRKWVDWYEVHLNPDGTIFDYHGAPGKWQSTGDFDSVDSYAATYIELVWEVYRSDRDRAWLKARITAITRALAVIRRVLQPNGLTIAKPTYPVMYTMDNVETLRGLRAAMKIQNTVGERAETAKIERIATAMEKAISVDLWDTAQQCYRVDIQTDGGKEEGLGKWYPNVMANLMAIAWLPASPRNRALLGRLKDRFGKDLPASIGKEEDLDRLVWWSLAAHGAGDSVLLEELKRRLAGSAPAAARLDNLALLGHICRLFNAKSE